MYYILLRGSIFMVSLPPYSANSLQRSLYSNMKNVKACEIWIKM